MIILNIGRRRPRPPPSPWSEVRGRRRAPKPGAAPRRAARLSLKGGKPLMATLDPIPAGQSMPGRPYDRRRTMNRDSKQKGSQMNRFLSSIAAAAMLVVSAAAARAQDATAPAAAQPAHLTLSLAAIGSAEDADKVTTALKGVKGVTLVMGLTPDSKQAVVTYMPGQVSVQQIAQAVADVPGKADNPFRAELMVHVENLSDSATQ